jgi:hypothetical protein
MKDLLSFVAKYPKNGAQKEFLRFTIVDYSPGGLYYKNGIIVY